MLNLFGFPALSNFEDVSDRNRIKATEKNKFSHETVGLKLHRESNT